MELLRAYCQRVCIARQLAEEIERFEPEWLREEGGPERLNLLAQMLDREHRTMLSLSRALRLCHSTQLDRSAAGVRARQGPTHVPWERLG